MLYITYITYFIFILHAIGRAELCGFSHHGWPFASKGLSERHPGPTGSQGPPLVLLRGQSTRARTASQHSPQSSAPRRAPHSSGAASGRQRLPRGAARPRRPFPSPSPHRAPPAVPLPPGRPSRGRTLLPPRAVPPAPLAPGPPSSPAQLLARPAWRFPGRRGPGTLAPFPPNMAPIPPCLPRPPRCRPRGYRAAAAAGGRAGARAAAGRAPGRSAGRTVRTRRRGRWARRAWRWRSAAGWRPPRAALAAPRPPRPAGRSPGRRRCLARCPPGPSSREPSRYCSRCRSRSPPFRGGPTRLRGPEASPGWRGSRRRHRLSTRSADSACAPPPRRERSGTSRAAVPPPVSLSCRHDSSFYLPRPSSCCTSEPRHKNYNTRHATRVHPRPASRGLTGNGVACVPCALRNCNSRRPPRAPCVPAGPAPSSRSVRDTGLAWRPQAGQELPGSAAIGARSHRTRPAEQRCGGTGQWRQQNSRGSCEAHALPRDARGNAALPVHPNNRMRGKFQFW